MSTNHTIGKRFLLGLTVLGLGAGLASTALAQEEHDPGGAGIDRSTFGKMSAPERLETWIAREQEHINARETGLAALKTCYSVLTPEQQKVFNDNMPGGEHGPRHGHMMH
ncbi:MAG: protein CpxP [Janthinobacterium sp.]|jgi:protein CpxP